MRSLTRRGCWTKKGSNGGLVGWLRVEWKARLSRSVRGTHAGTFIHRTIHCLDDILQLPFSCTLKFEFATEQLSIYNRRGNYIYVQRINVAAITVPPPTLA
jgi:hypothetical protein